MIFINFCSDLIKCVIFCINNGGDGTQSPYKKVDVPSHLTIHYYIILYYIIVYHIILYYITLRHILCCPVMCYTVLYYTMLYYTILYYTIVYYAMLCYTMVCSAVVYSSIFCNGGHFVMVEMGHNPLQEDGCLTPSHYMV